MLSSLPEARAGATVGTEGHAQHFALVSLEVGLTDRLARLDVPEPNGAACAGEARVTPSGLNSTLWLCTVRTAQRALRRARGSSGSKAGCRRRRRARGSSRQD